MTIKITRQNNQILVRRWKYCSDRKRSLPTTVCSVSINSDKINLPSEVISQHSIDASEQDTFRDYMEKLNEARSISRVKYTLAGLTESLNVAKQALTDPEMREILDLQEYEELSETINDIKKIITKNKNTVKRRSKKTKFTLSVQ